MRACCPWFVPLPFARALRPTPAPQGRNHFAAETAIKASGLMRTKDFAVWLSERSRRQLTLCLARHPLRVPPNSERCEPLTDRDKTSLGKNAGVPHQHAFVLRDQERPSGQRIFRVTLFWGMVVGSLRICMRSTCSNPTRMEIKRQRKRRDMEDERYCMQPGDCLPACPRATTRVGVRQGGRAHCFWRRWI